MERTVLVNEITIKGNTRVGHVTCPASGRRHAHGLGTVGEPIRPYEGGRSEGYRIELPADLREVSIRRVDFTRVGKDGRYVYRPATWSDLGAADVYGGTE